MEWLNSYAFKAEERIDADVELARKTYTRLAKRLKEHGTGSVLLFGTLKEKSNLVLAEAMQAEGIRAFVGKLSMDISSSKTYVESSADASLEAAKSFVKHMRSTFSDINGNHLLVQPVVTPRFVPTCSDDLLSGLSALAIQEKLLVQSHLAEARDQVDWVNKERGLNDIDVFDRCGLLTSRTVQAHCTFLTPTCFSRLQARGTAIAHCPLSNAYFSSKPFGLREALDRNVKIGLGTDVAGGYSIDIMNSMRTAVLVSRMREGEKTESLISKRTSLAENGDHRELSINWKEALYLSTRGGAIALSLALNAGLFDPGAPFDAQIINLYNHDIQEGVGPLDFLDEPSASVPVTEEMLEKWWCVGDASNRASLWVQGQMCYARKSDR